MYILVIRDVITTKSTTSTVFIDGNCNCHFLEDPVREKLVDGKWVWKPEYKIPKKTAIPSGTYPIVITRSTRFKRRLPLIQHVPDFTGIRIHPGNDAEDTEGCPLPGKIRSQDWVSHSREAFNFLFEKILNAIENEDQVMIEFKNLFTPSDGER